jgi:hypothetical protein
MEGNNSDCTEFCYTTCKELHNSGRYPVSVDMLFRITDELVLAYVIHIFRIAISGTNCSKNNLIGSYSAELADKTGRKVSKPSSMKFMDNRPSTARHKNTIRDLSEERNKLLQLK